MNTSLINAIFRDAEKDNRFFLLEHEFYRLLSVMGIKIPDHVFIKKGQPLPEKEIKSISSKNLVLKIVSPQIIHKSDVGGVRFVKNEIEEVERSVSGMFEDIPESYRNWIEKSSGKILSLEDIEQEIRGILVVEAVEHEQEGFGSELLIGLRNTREFGPVVTMGAGGTDVEYMSGHLKPGRALAIASAPLIGELDVLSLLQPLAFFSKITDEFRGRKHLVDPDKLVTVFERFGRLAAYYSSFEKYNEYVLEEAEVNPFVIRSGQLIPLDGMCRFSKNLKPLEIRPFDQIDFLLKPDSIGIIGVSEKMNIGHIILNNILKQGFPQKNIYVVKPGVKHIEGCLCVPSVSDLPETVDMFVLTVSAEQSREIMEDLIRTGKARSVIIIAGGIGEKKGTESLEKDIRSLLKKGRAQNKVTPVVNGGNCLGIISRPGKYDTTFVPEYKLFRQPRRKAQRESLVYLSQSGAFMISRMSKIPGVDPNYAVSIGNQIDLTLSDYLNYFKDKPDANILAVYIEGFLDGDGLNFIQAAREISEQKEKTIVVYKAGRSPEGRSATGSHTASVAGDYSVSRALLEQAGVIVVEDIFEFENFVKNLCFLKNKKIRGNKVGLISNAGFECVAMSDNLKNDLELSLADFSPQTIQKIIQLLQPLGIDRLQDIRNPIDITPVADDRTFCGVVEAMLDDENVDCAVVSPLPMSPAMQTLAPSAYHKEDLNRDGSTGRLLTEIFHRTEKPMVVSIDSGEIYQPLVDLLEDEGIPTFRHSDDAVRFMRKYVSVRNTKLT